MIPEILSAVRALPGSDDVLHQTCLTSEDAPVLEMLARGLEGPVLEIGTRHGLTAALFASLGLDVATVDVEPSPYRRAVWEACGVSDRVTGVWDGRVPAGEYRAAFVDAVHTYRGCRQHWRQIAPFMAKGATLLFDDMDYNGGEGGRFWRELGAEDFGRFGRLVLS